MTTHPIIKVLSLPGVFPSTKQRIAFWLEALDRKPGNPLRRKAILTTLRQLKFQAEQEHITYGHRVTK